jgi:hypothetical protein
MRPELQRHATCQQANYGTSSLLCLSLESNPANRPQY